MALARAPLPPSDVGRIVPFPSVDRARDRSRDARGGGATPDGSALITLALPVASEPYGTRPINPDRCAWPRRGLPAGAYVDETGRTRGACECECGCRRLERKYRRCARCGAGRHPTPQAAAIPLAARSAMAFGDWGDKPPTADVLRSRLDGYLRDMRPPEGRGDMTHGQAIGHATRR